jgi:hypothetical protein
MRAILQLGPKSASPVLSRFAPELTQFFDVWQSLRTGTSLPTLADYLDAAPLSLQPAVSILDISSPDDITVRLFGTALVAMAGQDFTKQPLKAVYPALELNRVGRIAWAAASHPAGYICVRSVKSAGGFQLDSDSICLPLTANHGTARCLVTYMKFPEQLPKALPTDAASTVTNTEFIDWLDIGAGVPSKP